MSIRMKDPCSVPVRRERGVWQSSSASVRRRAGRCSVSPRRVCLCSPPWRSGVVVVEESLVSSLYGSVWRKLSESMVHTPSVRPSGRFSVCLCAGFAFLSDGTDVVVFPFRPCVKLQCKSITGHMTALFHFCTQEMNSLSSAVACAFCVCVCVCARAQTHPTHILSILKQNWAFLFFHNLLEVCESALG